MAEFLVCAEQQLCFELSKQLNAKETEGYNVVFLDSLQMCDQKGVLQPKLLPEECPNPEQEAEVRAVGILGGEWGLQEVLVQGCDESASSC